MTLETKVSTKRLGYIDALRGLTMLLVVFAHIETFSLGISPYDAIISNIFVLFRMPMFFFISGYIAYKLTDWNKGYYLNMLLKKGRIQLIPTIFFYILFYCICGEKNILSFFTEGPEGYWFTVALFYMFLYYYTIMYLCSRYTSKTIDIALIVSAVIYGIIYAGSLQFYSLWEYPCIKNLTNYFGYFTLGILCRKHSTLFIQIISKERVKTVLLLSFLGLFIISWKNTLIDYSSLSVFNNKWGTLLQLIDLLNNEFTLRILGVLLVFSVFYQYRNFFDSDIRPVRWLRFVGRRTLDIYMLHYFFLPDLKFMTPWLSEHKQIGGGANFSYQFVCQ